MKRSFPPAFFILLLCLFSNSLSGQQRIYSQYLDHPWVDSMMSTLSMEEKTAQSLWVIAGPENGLHEIMDGAISIREHGLGGLIFTEGPNKQMQALADYCRSHSTIPLAIALEGRWSEQYPHMGSLAAIANDSLRYLAGSNLACLIRKAGVSVVLTKGMDDALAAGLTDKHIQILDPRWIQRIRISELGNCLDTQIPADSIEYRARQVLALKYWIMQQEVVAGKGIQEVMATGGHHQSAFIRDLYAHSLTVLNNQNQVIPVRELGNTRIACLAVNQQGMTGFQKMAGQYTRTENYFWLPDSENNNELIKELSTYDLVIAGVYPGQSPEATEAFISSLGQKTELILVWFGDAESLDGCLSIASNGKSPEAEGLILAYDQKPITQGLSAQLIFGGISGRGRLPVAIGDQYPVGFGITTPGGLRL
ncbi:MAG: hypothetical protein U9R49_05040, partial [Bacteroidota bacterium]|nr:hypothetical protein [Bacteroidota bacterium]